MGVSTACARTLVDEWARAGLADAVLAPGSRSAPLALALADDDRIRLHVHLDERSAAFFALGAAKASGRPVLVLCTSGTAAAHFHPAVLEAHHSRVPLIVVTADRPAELRATGAPQTTDQVRLYGDAVRWFADVPADGDPAARAAWRPVAARLWADAAGPPAGPVHLNVAFREPLVPAADPGADPAQPGRDGGHPWIVSRRPAVAIDEAGGAAVLERIGAARRGLVVAGWGSPPEASAVAGALGWPLLADAISGCRTGGGPHGLQPAAGGTHGPEAVAGGSHGPEPAAGGTITTYEALLRVPGFAEAHRPDAVIRFGGPLTSKIAMAWLDGSIPQILVDPDGAWLDPNRTAAERVPALPDLRPVAADRSGRAATPEAGAWLAGWTEAERVARRALDDFLDADDRPSEARLARDVAAVCASADAEPALVVASSMPVRDLEAFAARVPRSVFANRGVNGIDGLVSTVLGVAAGVDAGGGPVPAGPVPSGAGRRRRRRPVVGLLGDLAFLHDAGGLLGAATRGLDAVFVVVDNGGGGIFSFLPQAALPAERFERLFGTPPAAGAAAVAQAYGVPAERVERAAEVGPALERALSAGGVRVLIVPTGDRTANVERHRSAWSAVAEALPPPTP